MITGNDSSLYYSDQSAKLPAFGAFAGSDMVASINVPGVGPKVFAELATITYSTHRDVRPVRTLGRINPKGFTRAGRTIAGSLIFAVFDRHALLEVLNKIGDSYLKDLKTKKLGNITIPNSRIKVVTDEMPPFDVTISMANEYGSASKIAIYGIRVVDEGQTMSIEDMITENVMQYYAQGIDLLGQE